jgi:hypothetical protein
MFEKTRIAAYTKRLEALAASVPRYRENYGTRRFADTFSQELPPYGEGFQLMAAAAWKVGLPEPLFAGLCVQSLLDRIPPRLVMDELRRDPELRKYSRYFDAFSAEIGRILELLDRIPPGLVMDELRRDPELRKYSRYFDAFSAEIGRRILDGP